MCRRKNNHTKNSHHYQQPLGNCKQFLPVPSNGAARDMIPVQFFMKIKFNFFEYFLKMSIEQNNLTDSPGILRKIVR